MNIKERFICYGAANDFSLKEIGEALSLSEEVVRLKLTAKELKTNVEELKAKLTARDPANEHDYQGILHEGLPRALKILREAMDDPSAKVQTKIQAAQDWIDRAKGKAKQTMEHQGSLLRDVFERLDTMKDVSPLIELGTEIQEELPSPKKQINPNTSKDMVKSWIEDHI